MLPSSRTTDRPLPSPSSTPKSGAFPENVFRTPRTEVPQSHFLDAWTTPQANGQQTPVQTPSFSISTPVAPASQNYKPRTVDDPGFHVNHFVPNTLPLPPVDPSRRLSSSPDPSSVRGSESGREGRQFSLSAVRAMDPSQMAQMQTPPPTRDASQRINPRQSGANGFTTPATVIARTPTQDAGGNVLYAQSPFGFPSLQFSPEMAHYASTGPLSAPALPQSRLFWDQQHDSNTMNMNLAMTDPFGPTPNGANNSINWQAYGSQPNQVNQEAFQALHGLSSPSHAAPFAASSMDAQQPKSNSRTNSFSSTSASVDPSMLFSFSSPGPSASFGNQPQNAFPNFEGRRPYETQAMDSLREKEEREKDRDLRERELARKAMGQHSRTNTSSSAESIQEVRPGIQRSNTDSGFRRSRPSSMESRSSGSAAGYHIPRRSSPLKRQSAGSLVAIPEIRRPRTRLVVDEDGRARTETVADVDERESRESRRSSRNELKLQYPGLWSANDSDSEADEPALSRNNSFTIPPPRSSKHTRTDSGGLSHSSPMKMIRPSSGIFDKSAPDPVRSNNKRGGERAYRRFSMMDFPTSFNSLNESQDQDMPDSPGDALGALKKVVEGRNKRTGTLSIPFSAISLTPCRAIFT